MAATAAANGCKTSTFFPISVPKPPPSHKFSTLSTQFFHSYRCASYSISTTQYQLYSPSELVSTTAVRSVSSPETSVVEDAAEESGTPSPDNEMPLDSATLPPLTGCQACGKEEIERGCNGEGRIQGGIATVPGFGWWPIKAYRPCPAYVASGGRYRRMGQSMDEVVSGRAGDGNGAQSSKKKEGSKKMKQ